MNRFLLSLSVILCLSINVLAKDYSDYGKLKLVNNQLCDNAGNPIQLRGVSSSLNFAEPYASTKADLQYMKDLGANVLTYSRIGDYIGNSDVIHEVLKMVKWAEEKDMYIIVDITFAFKEYISLSKNSNFLTGAKSFFDQVSKEVDAKGYKHVIYSLCSMARDFTWQEIKAYASEIIPIITGNDRGAIILVGLPDCHNFSEVLNDPINPEDYPKASIMYGFDYYTDLSATSETVISDFKAATKTLPLYVTSWSFGDGAHYGENANSVDEDAANEFLKACYDNSGRKLISWCAGEWMNRSPSRPYAIWYEYPFHSFSDGRLSPAGSFIASALTAGEPVIPTVKADVNNDGTVNSADVVSVYNFIINGEGAKDKVDVNSDGTVNSADVVAVYNYIINGE